MFPNNQQNKKPVSVNTRARRLSNDKSQVSSLMEMGFWDGFVTVRIHPALPAEMRSETKKWDLENYLQATLSPDKASYLVRKITKDIEPAIIEGTEAQANVVISGDTVFQIKTKNVDGQQITLASIFKGLDPTTRKPANMISYHFKDNLVLDEYDHETGDSIVGQDMQGELDLFKWHLVGSLIGGTNALVHAHRVVDRVFREKLTGGSSNSESSFGGNRSNIFGGGNNNGPSQSSNTNPFGVDQVNTDELNNMMKM